MIIVADFGDQKLDICIFLLHVQSSTTEKVLPKWKFYFEKKAILSQKSNFFIELCYSLL